MSKVKGKSIARRGISFGVFTEPNRGGTDYMHKEIFKLFMSSPLKSAEFRKTANKELDGNEVSHFELRSYCRKLIG